MEDMNAPSQEETPPTATATAKPTASKVLVNGKEVAFDAYNINENNYFILHFEENMNTFKEGFARNFELASRRFNEAIEDIDKTIKALEKTKADLLSSDRNLRLANDKAQDLSIKKLTRGAPSVKEMFDELSKKPQS